MIDTNNLHQGWEQFFASCFSVTLLPVPNRYYKFSMFILAKQQVSSNLR